MKSEHRHELAENDLSKLIDHGRDRIEPYANKILLGVLIATVLIVGAIVVYRTRGSSSMAGAAELAAARTAADYDAVAADYPGTTVGLWARVRAGEMHLRDGIRLSLTNRAASNESLQSAQKAFEQVLKSDDAVPEMRELALWGLAVCLESQTSEQTTTKPAIEAYEQLKKEFPESRFVAQADARIAALQNPQAGEFYAWFHAQNPKPEDRPGPRDFPELPSDGEAGNPFSGLGQPPDMPAEAGAATDATTPDADAPATTPVATAPATDAATPAESPAATEESATPASDTTTPTPEGDQPAATPESATEPAADPAAGPNPPADQ